MVWVVEVAGDEPGTEAELSRRFGEQHCKVAARPPPAVECFMPNSKRPQKITLAKMRASGVRGLLIYCSDYQYSHWTAISGDPWPDDVRLSDLEPRFTCQACGRRGADVRPDWESAEEYA